MNPLATFVPGTSDWSPTKRLVNDLESRLGDKEIRIVTYKKSAQNGLEFSIRGGRELGIGIYVSRIDPFSDAEKAGIKAGDQIISVNGKSFESIPLQEAIQILRSANILVLTLCNVGRVPFSCILHQTYTWVDRHGRKVSPPDEYEPQFHRSSSTWSLYSSTKNSKLRKVTLSLEESESLGIMIRGGTEYGLGIFITGVDSDSAADRANLQVGDQVLEVNDISFEEITHDEAVRILKNNKHLVMKILNVGKIPFSCTMYDEMLWSTPGVDAPDDLSSLSLDDELSNSDPCFMLSDPDTLKILNEKAKLLLSRKEHATLNYYRTEYEKGQVTLDAFIAVLLEILNTADKFSILAEIRELIPILEREKFDDMIYSRELEIKKACQKLGPSIDNLIAHRKANRTRRNSADSFKYVAIDKSTGKICLHPNCSPEREKSRRSLYMNGQKKCLYHYESPSRNMFLSSQALNWTTDEFYFDDSRTPSEDSGVDLPNGFFHSNKDCPWKELYQLQNRHSFALDISQREHQEAELQRELWAQRRHSSGWEASIEAKICDQLMLPIGQIQKKQSVSQSLLNDSYKLEAKMKNSKQKVEFFHNQLHMQQHQQRQLPAIPAKSQSQPLDLQSKNQPRISRTLPNIPHMLQNQSLQKLNQQIDKQLRLFIPKVRPVLGIAIEGGADTCHALPRIINILPQGAASQTIGLKVGLVILNVNGISLIGLSHKEVANLITKTFASQSQPMMEIVVGEMKKPTQEMKHQSRNMLATDIRQCM